MAGVKGRSGRKPKIVPLAGGNLTKPREIASADAQKFYDFLLRHLPEVKSCDEMYLLLASRTFENWQYCARLVEVNGVTDCEGKLRPEAKMERTYYKDLMAILKECGTTPGSRAKLLTQSADGVVLEQQMIDLDIGEPI